MTNIQHWLAIVPNGQIRDGQVLMENDEWQDYTGAGYIGIFEETKQQAMQKAIKWAGEINHIELINLDYLKGETNE